MKDKSKQKLRRSFRSVVKNNPKKVLELLKAMKAAGKDLEKARQLLEEFNKEVSQEVQT